MNKDSKKKITKKELLELIDELALRVSSLEVQLSAVHQRTIPNLTGKLLQVTCSSCGMDPSKGGVCASIACPWRPQITC